MSRPHELWPGRVRAAFADAFADAASVEDGYGPLAVDVPAELWLEALLLARDGLDCGFFDFLTAVDEEADGFRLVCHVAARPEHRRRDDRARGVEHLVVRTLVPRDRPVVVSAADAYAGARWHERETHEMFGVEFGEADPDGAVGAALPLAKLLLPEEFEGHPLRKDFVLASRVAKPWPGAKEPGESDHAVAEGPPARRRVKPPGVPDDWRVSATTEEPEGDTDG